MIEKITIETYSYFKREFKYYEEGTIVLEKEDIARLSNNFSQRIYVTFYPKSSMQIEVKDDCVVIEFQAYIDSMSQDGVIVKKGEKKNFSEGTFTYDIEASHLVRIE